MEDWISAILAAKSLFKAGALVTIMMIIANLIGLKLGVYDEFFVTEEYITICYIIMWAILALTSTMFGFTFTLFFGIWVGSVITYNLTRKLLFYYSKWRLTRGAQ